MIYRDDKGFIGQAGVDRNLKQIQPIVLDHGDTACRTGILAMCGSEQDADLLIDLIDETELLRRHPTQEPHCKPSELSRDQLIGWAAGSKKPRTRQERLLMSDVILSYAEDGRVNKDILGFDVRLYLYKASGLTEPPLHIYALGMAQLPLTIMWHCFVKPDHELNQLICQLSVFDPKWMRMMTNLHTSWRANLVNYWSGWRNQPEIALMLIQFVQDKIK